MKEVNIRNLPDTEKLEREEAKAVKGGGGKIPKPKGVIEYQDGQDPITRWSENDGLGTSKDGISSET